MMKILAMVVLLIIVVRRMTQPLAMASSSHGLLRSFKSGC